MMRRRVWGAGMMGLAGAAALGGCASKIFLSGAEGVVGDTLLVRVKDAWVTGERVYVRTWMKNQTDEVVTIDRDGMQLRLADGTVLDRSSGKTTQHTPYSLSPGMGHDVYVDFRGDPDALASMKECWLVVGGILVGKASAAKSIGDVRLTPSEE